MAKSWRAAEALAVDLSEDTRNIEISTVVGSNSMGGAALLAGYGAIREEVTKLRLYSSSRPEQQINLEISLGIVSKALYISFLLIVILVSVLRVDSRTTDRWKCQTACSNQECNIGEEVLDDPTSCVSETYTTSEGHKAVGWDPVIDAPEFSSRVFVLLVDSGSITVNANPIVGTARIKEHTKQFNEDKSVSISETCCSITGHCDAGFCIGNPKVIGSFAEQGGKLVSYRIEVVDALVAEPHLNLSQFSGFAVVTEQENWLTAEYILRLTGFCVSLAFCVAMIRNMKLPFTHSICAGKVGVGYELGFWFVVLLIGYMCRCNPFYYISGSHLSDYVLQPIFTYTKYTYCIALLRICWLGMNRAECSPLRAHAVPMLYFVSCLLLHFAVVFTIGGQPFLIHSYAETGIGAWVLFFIIQSIAVIYVVVMTFQLYNRLSFVAFSPCSCAFLLVRWYNHYITVSIILGLGVDIYHAIQTDSFLVDRSSILELAEATVFVFYNGFAVFSRSRQLDGAPPDTPRKTWQRMTWKKLQLKKLYYTYFMRYFFGTNAAYAKWSSLQPQGEAPPMFCLETCDWLWAISWEVHATDPRVVFPWKVLSCSETAAMGALPDRFRSYAIRYSDPTGNLKGSLEDDARPGLRPDIPLNLSRSFRRLYQSNDVDPKSRFHFNDNEGFEKRLNSSSCSSLSSASEMKPSPVTPAGLRSPIFEAEAQTFRRTCTLHRYEVGEGAQAPKKLEPQEELHVKGHDKAKTSMNWSHLGLELVSVISNGFNQASVLCSDNSILVSFRGTLNVDNVKSDCAAWFKEVKRNKYGTMRVHAGFMNVWDVFMRSEVITKVCQCMVAEIAFKYARTRVVKQPVKWMNERAAITPVGTPVRPLFVCGHSLGGALATLCAFQLSGVVRTFDEFFYDQRVRRLEIIKKQMIAFFVIHRTYVCASEEESLHELKLRQLELETMASPSTGIVKHASMKWNSYLDENNEREWDIDFPSSPILPPPQRDVIVYTFGAPRVGNKAFKRAYNKKVEHTFRVVNGNDVITQLPPPGFGVNWCHVGKLVMVCVNKM